MPEEDQYPGFDELCKAVGFTVLSWSHIEIMLDASIAIIFQNCGGDRIYPQIPRNLKSKVIFMRKSLRQLEVLGKFQELGLELMDRISNMKSSRHDVAHGVPTSLATQDGVYQFRKLEAKETIHQIQTSGFDLKTFPDFARDLSRLGTDMVRFCQVLAEEYAGAPRQSPP